MSGGGVVVVGLFGIALCCHLWDASLDYFTAKVAERQSRVPNQPLKKSIGINKHNEWVEINEGS